MSADNHLQPYVYSEFTAIKDTVLEMQQGGFGDLFTMGPDRHLHRTILAYVNQVFQQISGINLITYYAAAIYENQIGLTPFSSRVFPLLEMAQSMLQHHGLPASQLRYSVVATSCYSVPLACPCP